MQLIIIQFRYLSKCFAKKVIPDQILPLLVMLLAILGCTTEQNSTTKPAEQKKIMIAGSTSIQPMVEELAEHYMKSHPNITIEVQGGGSSAGIQAARSGAADIGMSSRELKDGEKDLITHVIAYDAIILIVHPSNPINNLSLKQIQNIFSYQDRDWSAIDSNIKGEITIITREEGSGTRGAFEELAMHKIEISQRCLVQDSTGAVREIVSSDSRAIGYISLGALNGKVKPLAIEGITIVKRNFQKDEETQCYELQKESVETKDKAKKYMLIRPFLFVSSTPFTGVAQDFIHYIHSDEGKQLLQKEGLMPSHD